MEVVQMKKVFAVMIAIGLAVSVFSSADAGNNNGMGGGCANCPQECGPKDQFRKFQSDTIDLRQEMMLKRFEMQRENLKATPDATKIFALQSEIKAIQSKILTIRTQSGLPVDKCDGECPQMMGDCSKVPGDCGKITGGCNKTPCGQKKTAK
jgi:hypothetical protein